MTEDVPIRNYVDKQDENLRREYVREADALRREFTNELRSVRHEVSDVTVGVAALDAKVDALGSRDDQLRGVAALKDKVWMGAVALSSGGLVAAVSALAHH